MVTVTTTCKRCTPDTIKGECFVLTTEYTSFDAEEIDIIEERFKEAAGSGITSQFEVKEQEHERVHSD